MQLPKQAILRTHYSMMPHLQLRAPPSDVALLPETNNSPWQCLAAGWGVRCRQESANQFINRAARQHNNGFSCFPLPFSVFAT